MKTTSHFIGVNVDSTQLANMFVAINSYTRLNGAHEAITMQDINSTHATLHYLPGELSDGETSSILNSIRTLSETMSSDITLLGIEYFGEQGDEKVCFIKCEVDQWSDGARMHLIEKYPHDEVYENQLKFVYHITLFKVLDTIAFAPHKNAIDSIVTEHVKKIDGMARATGLKLYRVNSNYSPEIQIPV